jgi:hypothetical protein
LISGHGTICFLSKTKKLGLIKTTSGHLAFFGPFTQLIAQRVNKMLPDAKFLMATELEKSVECNLTFESKVCFNGLLFNDKRSVPYIATQLWYDEEVMLLLSDGAQEFLSPSSGQELSFEVKNAYSKYAQTFFEGILTNYRLHAKEESVSIATDIMGELIDRIFSERVDPPIEVSHRTGHKQIGKSIQVEVSVESKDPDVQSGEKEKTEIVQAESKFETDKKPNETTSETVVNLHKVVEEKTADSSSSSLVDLEHVTFHSMINRGGGILECRQVGGGADGDKQLCYFELNDLNVDSQTNIQVIIKILLNQFPGLQIRYKGQRAESGKAIQFICHTVDIVGQVPVPVKMKTRSEISITMDESKMKRFSEVENLFSKGKFLLLSSIEYSPKIEMVHHSVKCMINDQYGILECHAKSDKLQLSILSYFEVADLNFEGKFDARDVVDILSTKSEDFVIKYRARRVDVKKGFPLSNMLHICESIEVKGKLPSRLCHVKLGKKKPAKFVNSDKLDRFLIAQKCLSIGNFKTVEEILSKK